MIIFAILLFALASAQCPKTIHTISKLPGVDLTNLCTYAGLIEVNPANKGSLFYWLFLNPNPSAPLVIFLNGGPGSSSMIALFTENGPLRVAKSLKVTLDKNSWLEDASVIFIDQPVGVGFSIGDQPVKNEDELSADMV